MARTKKPTQSRNPHILKKGKWTCNYLRLSLGRLQIRADPIIVITEMKTFKDVMEGLKVIGAGTATIALAGAASRNWKDIQFVDPFSSTESVIGY
ncbi:hypothetical protein L1987_88567 [Smallanthus sonchifolius]|nr:hypothetical protein L1987_88567 [Smallanthus sonchifolius]